MRSITPQIRSAPSQLSAAGSIRVQIDTLRLHGFPRATVRHVVFALERELTHLFSTRGLTSLPSASPRIDAGTVSAARPEQTGARIARAIHRGLQS